MTSVVHRRAFLGAMAGSLLAAPLAAEGQQARKVPRIALFLPPGANPRGTGLSGWHARTRLGRGRSRGPKAIDELDPEDLADALRLTQDGSPDFTADRKVSQITVSSRKL